MSNIYSEGKNMAASQGRIVLENVNPMGCAVLSEYFTANGIKPVMAIKPTDDSFFGGFTLKAGDLTTGQACYVAALVGANSFRYVP